MNLKFVAANLLLERLVLGVLLVFCVECYQLEQKYIILLSSHNASLAISLAVILVGLQIHIDDT